MGEGGRKGMSSMPGDIGKMLRQGGDPTTLVGKLPGMIGQGSRGMKLGGDSPMSRGGQSGRPDGIQMPRPEGKAKARLTRTEFVILFVWREPTPSDLLLPEDTGPAADAGGLGMALPGGAVRVKSN